MPDPREFPETGTLSPRPAGGSKETSEHVPPGAETPPSVASVFDPDTTDPSGGSRPAGPPTASTETLPPSPGGWPYPPTDPDLPGALLTAVAVKSLPVIPGFDILGEIGRGGMGVVFKARQLDLNRLVAIKMVLADKFDRPEDLVRFRLEAEMVARVRHPNVVQVYDSGAWEGHPYLVLEWVEGGTLGSYLTERPQPPDVGARTVELLARAIHAAHCNGVVHRDLKPGNILVARGGESESGATRPASTVNRHDTLSTTLTIDGRPVPMTPKIADFGIAKQLVGATHLTETGRIMGTPEYMAPEQADGRSDLTGPATDVYALGVILYQMLTGRTPFRGGSGVALLMRVIEEEPKRPGALQPKIPRDLETICLKCLAKHPLRRYQTAESLADDLCAFLEGRPIGARPAGAAERAWKWAQRRPAVAALSAAAVLFFVLGFAGVTWQWRAAAAQRDRAVSAEQALGTEKAVTDAVNHFLLDDLLATAAPEKSLGRKLTVADVLQNASARIDGAFVGQPEVAAAVRLALGNTYRKLGLFEPADRHLTVGLNLRRQTLGDTHRDTLSAASDRGLLLADKHNWDEAIPLLRQVVAESRAQLKPDDPHLIDAVDRLALVLQDRGDFAEAEELFNEALASARRSFGPEDSRTLTVLNDLGLLQRDRKQLPQAEATFRAAADGRAKALAPSHPATLESLSNLAVVLDDQGRWAEAKPIYKQVLADKIQVLGPEHIDTLSTLNNLADLLGRHDDPDAAAPLFEEAFAGFKAKLGADNPLTLKAQSQIGQCAFLIGKRDHSQEELDRAERTLAAVLSSRRRTMPDHRDTSQSASDLATVLVYRSRPNADRLAEAEQLFKEALTGRRKSLGPADPETLQTVAGYVDVLRKRRKAPEAIAECESSLAAANQAAVAEHPAAIVVLCLLVEMKAADKARLPDALALAERAVVLTRKVHPDSVKETTRALRNLGAILVGLERPADAEPHLRSVYDLTREKLGERNIQTLREGSKLGECLLALKKYADAQPLLVEYYEALRRNRDALPTARRAAGDQVVKLYEAWGKPDQAAEWREKLK